MKFARSQLQKYRQQPLLIDEQLDLSAAVSERFSDQFIALPPVHVMGDVRCDPTSDDLFVSLTVTGEMTLPSSRSLAPVGLPLSLTINEQYVMTEERLANFPEEEPVFVLTDNVLVIDDLVLDNIVAELPLQVLTAEELASDALPTGDDWTVVSESDYDEQAVGDLPSEEAPVDSRFAKLDDFFKD